MAIRLKAIEFGEPGVKGGGNKKYICRAVSDGEADLDELTARIEKMSTMSGADIRGVLYALISVSKDMLSDGKIVRFGDLGSFRISVSSHIEDSAEKVNGKSVKGAKLIFTVGKYFKRMLKTLDYKRF
jgi:predicted histone-like DNA-binding protein